MTARDVIQYLLHFDLDTPVAFLDSDGYLHDVTDYSNENYLGNGKYNERPDSIVFQSVGRKRFRVIKDGHSNYTSQDFKDYNGYVRILNGKYAGKVAHVIGIPVSEGGNVYYTFPNSVTVFFDNGAETFSASSLDKITEEEYNEIIKNDGK